MLLTEFPSSIRSINSLPTDKKTAIYKTLLPDWLFVDYKLDHETLRIDGEPAVRFRYPHASRAVEIEVKRSPDDIDPILYCNIADTFNNQIIVLLVIVNDPDAPRYNIDYDLDGNRTHLGTTSRNLHAELAALQAGLAPGQVRNGLRSFKTLVPIFEIFVKRMNHSVFFIEPLAYHNAVIFEQYGFSYVKGLKAMQQIHEGFLDGGELFKKLDGRSPFRYPHAANSVRGRSWAIHDGILGYPYTGFQMYKRIGQYANTITCQGIPW